MCSCNNSTTLVETLRVLNTKWRDKVAKYFLQIYSISIGGDATKPCFYCDSST